MTRTTFAWTGFFALSLLTILSGCSGDGGSAGPLAPEQGQLTVEIHDAAAPALTVAEVTFSAVEAHRVDGDWEPATGALPRTIDVLQFVGPENGTPLVQDLVPAGTYDALRVTITAVHLEVEGSEPVDVTLPAEGVTIVVPVDFVVAEGGQTEVSLDLRTDVAFQPLGTSWAFDPSGLVVSGVR